jgi:hypothetical protein
MTDAHKLHDLMKQAMPRYDEPLTVELADESESAGPVVFRDRHGYEVMRMSQEAYRALRGAGGGD